MDKFRIVVGRTLKGRVSISGAKNSALPCMAASVLTPETVILHNLPYVRDIITQRRLLEDLGATVLTPELRTHKINASHVELFEAPYELVKTMRGSVLALGPLLARFGKVTVTGTENLMLAATLATGRSVLHNAAREPEIVDLAELLNKMGARVL